MTLQELQSAPDFKKLSYEEQKKARAFWIEDYVLTDSKFQAFSDTEQLEVVRSLVEDAPVFENDDENAKLARSLAERIQAGDTEAIKEAKTRITWSQATKGSLVANAIVGIADVFDGPDRATYQMTYGNDSRKAQQWLMSKLPNRDRAEVQTNMQTGAVAVNVLEALLMNVSLVGTIGKAGLLTKGLMGAGGRIAKWAATLPHGLAYSVASEIGEQSVQAVMSALITTGSRVSLAALQDPDYRTSLNELAADVGTDIVFDWLAWTGLSAGAAMFRAVKYAGSSGRRALGDIKRMATELTTEQFQETFIKSVYQDNQTGREMRALLNPDDRKLVEAMQRGELVRLKTDMMKSPRGVVKLAGKSAGFDVVDDGTVFKIKPIEKLDIEGIERTFHDPREAMRFIRENAAKDIEPLVEGGIDRREVVATVQTTIPQSATFDAQLAARLVQPSIGNVYPRNVEFAVKDLLRNAGVKDDVLKPFKFISDQDYFKKPRAITDELRMKELKLPLSLDTPEHLARFKRDLIHNIETLGQGANQDTLNKLVGDLNTELDKFARFGDMNLSTMRFVAENTLKKPVKDLGGGRIQIGEEVFENWREANRAIIRDLAGGATQEGGFSIDELQQLIRERTGGTLKQNTKVIDIETGTKAEVFELRNARGEVLDTGDTPYEVLLKRPEVMDALSYPAAYGPKVMVIDPEARTIKFNQTAAIGTTANILEMGSRFKSFKTYKKIKVGTQSFELEADPKSSKWVLRVPETGAEKEFASGAEMMQYLRKDVRSFEELRNELYRRNFNSHVDVDGSVRIFDESGVVAHVTKKEQLEKFLKDHPVSESVQELFPMDQTMKNNLEVQVKKALERDALRREKIAKSPLRQAVQAVSQTVSVMMAPTESTLARIARDTGNNAGLLGWREMRRMQKFLNQKNALAQAGIEGIWKGTKELERTRASTLLQIDPSKWKTFYKNTFGEELPSALEEKALKQRAWFQSMYVAEGLDPSHLIQNYVPHIQRYVDSIKSRHLDMPKTPKALLRQVFGDQVPKELSFFGEHLRLDAFMDALAERDVAVSAGVWANSLFKKKYLGTGLETVNKGLEHMKALSQEGKISEAQINFYINSVKEFFGVKTTVGKIIQDASIRITDGLANIAENVPAFKEWGWDRSIRTDDLIGKLNTLFTYATQSFRAWAIPRNTTQVYLLNAFTGTNTAVGALDYVLSSPTYVGDLMRKGWISETLYTLGSENLHPVKGFWAAGLAPLEMTEVLTRATCFRTAEVMYDKAFSRLIKGTIDADAFTKELSLDMMDTPLLKQFMDLTSAGDTASAKKLLGDYFQDSTMFIYGKGQGGTATRGVVGRLFGKLGVYPMGTLDLYAKILQRGTGPEKVARAARIMAASTALYWAFNQAGIDYQGFLWTDPFEFSGGPFFSMGVNAMNAIGDGPEAALARSNLKRSVPNAFVPGFGLGRKVIEGVQYAGEGDWERAIASFSAAPNIVKDDKIRKFTMFGYK